MRRAILVSAAIGVLGAAATVAGFVFERNTTLFAYLFAWNSLASTVMGAFLLLLTCHAMGAVWPVAIRRLLEATIAVLPFLALAFVPILFGLDGLYPFMHPERVASPEVRKLLLHKHVWLNAPFFIGRSIGYLALWVLLAEVIRARSLQPLDEHKKGVLKALSAASLPLLGLTLTFASFDWVMALSPDWYSTMFGVYYFSGGFIAALALVVLLIAFGREHFERLTRSHFYALGRLLLAFIIFWAYVAYFQFFLIWIANKPIEARWYVERVKGGFLVESWLLGIGHFAVPFFVLLSYWVKQRLNRLLPIALVILVMHVVDVHWLVTPPRGFALSWTDLAALLGLGGFTVAFGLWRQLGKPLSAVSDPDYPRALSYESR